MIDIADLMGESILENQGVGPFRFGMTELDLLNNYVCEGKRIPKAKVGKNSYKFRDKNLCLSFDKDHPPKLESILVMNNFRGKFLGAIGIGSTIGELRARRRDFGFADDGELFLGIGYHFEIGLDYEDYERRYNKEFEDDVVYGVSQGEIDDLLIEYIFLRTWKKVHPYSASHSHWLADEDKWIEPDEKYLEVRYK